VNLGKAGEEKACQFLKAKGLRILARNFHSRFGELDIVAQSAEAVHFVEVKSTKHDDAIARITPQKLQKLYRTIEYYQLRHPFSADYQLDAIIVTKAGVEWVQNISHL
jgi:putative endonuclease